MRLRPFIRAAALLLMVLAPTGSSQAAQVPSHLASFASDLGRKLGPQFSSFNGSTEERRTLDAAQQLLRRSGVQSWAAQNIRLDNDATQLAGPLGLDLNRAQDWLTLQTLLSEPDPEQRAQQINALTKRKTPPREGGTDSASDDALGAFDRSNDEMLAKMARAYEMPVGAKGQLQILWSPDTHRLRMVIQGRLDDDDADSEYQVLLSGSVTPLLARDNDNIILRVAADDPGIRVLPPESLKKLRASIFGKWQESGGATWEISKAGGVAPSERNRDLADKSRAELQRAQSELEQIRKNKVYVWKDKDGREIRQDRFKRLDDSHTYVGETYAAKDAETRIAELEHTIASEQKKTATLPVDQYDPLGLNELVLDEPQAISISVTEPGGYEYSYRDAWFDGRRITADRTLANIEDIRGLPADVTSQLVASWSPPEWVELEVKPDTADTPIELEGQRWRLHVTYEVDEYGTGPNTVKSIHTPYPKSLLLSQSGIRSADGASKDEAL